MIICFYVNFHKLLDVEEDREAEVVAVERE